MTELRRRMTEDMRLHGLAEATQRTYLDAIANLARHFQRSPDQLTDEELRQFFVHLSQTQHRSKSTVRVHLFAAKFLYRYTLRRPSPTLDLLRDYWRQHRPAYWLFPDRTGSRPIRREAVLKAIDAAAKDAKLTKHVSCHTLRHSQATHLLENHADLRWIQAVLGHRSIRTTILYLHMTATTINNIQVIVNKLMADL